MAKELISMRVLLCIAMIAILAACGRRQLSRPAQPGTSTRPGGTDQQTQQEEAFKLMDRGEVVSQDGNRLLITAYVNGKDGPYIDAFWFTLNAQTELKDSSGNPIQQSDLPIGT